MQVQGLPCHTVSLKLAWATQQAASKLKVMRGLEKLDVVALAFVLSPGRQKQVDLSEASLVYIVSARTSRAI